MYTPSDHGATVQHLGLVEHEQVPVLASALRRVHLGHPPARHGRIALAPNGSILSRPL